jgi:hypothetical protein
MIIAGGCYREICESPRWDAWFGSGLRAATALAPLSGKLEFHTYHSNPNDLIFDALIALGVVVTALPRESDIAFSYFHPLTRPAISRVYRATEPAIKVSGDVVLRFGLLEGDAVVQAKRAIYDPQTFPWPDFSENGSAAEVLAVVLNENELQSADGTAGLHEAANEVMSKQNAAVVVTKCGARGAWVHQRNCKSAWIPAYKSDRVFKIGSGDIFSAAFAHYWGEKQIDAVNAADLASRCVARYANTRELPLQAESFLLDMVPASSIPFLEAKPTLAVWGSISTLSNRWLLEEARWCLRALGFDVLAPQLSPTPKTAKKAVAVMVLGDSWLSTPGVFEGERIVWFTEINKKAPTFLEKVLVKDDFVSALYWTAWLAADN